MLSEASEIISLSELPPPQCSIHNEASTALSREVFWGSQFSDQRKVTTKNFLLFCYPLQPSTDFNLSTSKFYYCTADSGTVIKRLLAKARWSSRVWRGLSDRLPAGRAVLRHTDSTTEPTNPPGLCLNTAGGPNPNRYLGRKIQYNLKRILSPPGGIDIIVRKQKQRASSQP